MRANHTLIPASAADYLMIWKRSPKEALASVPKYARPDKSILGWISELENPLHRRAGFALREDLDLHGWTGAAWIRAIEDASGTFYAWSAHAMACFVIPPHDEAAHAVLRDVFALGDEDMPDFVAQRRRNFSSGQAMERAHQAFEDRLSEITHAFLNRKDFGFGINFDLGHADVRPTLSHAALRAAHEDQNRLARIPARAQAAALYPAFDLTDPRLVAVIDEGKPLTRFLTETFGVTPSAIKDIRLFHFDKRLSPEVFRGVYGADIPTDPQKTPFFKALLAFSQETNLPFRFFSPLANRMSAPLVRPLRDSLIMAMNETMATDAVLGEVIGENGGARLMIRNVNALAARKRNYREGLDKILAFAERGDALPEISALNDYGFQGIRLRLLTTPKQILDHRFEQGYLFSKVPLFADAPETRIGSGPVAEIVMDGVGRHRYLAFDASGRPSVLWKRSLTMLHTDPPKGFEDFTSAARAMAADLVKNDALTSALARLCQTPKFRKWSACVSRALDSYGALRRKTSVHLSTHEALGFESRETMIARLGEDAIYPEL